MERNLLPVPRRTQQDVNEGQQPNPRGDAPLQIGGDHLTLLKPQQQPAMSLEQPQFWCSDGSTALLREDFTLPDNLSPTRSVEQQQNASIFKPNFTLSQSLIPGLSPLLGGGGVSQWRHRKQRSSGGGDTTCSLRRSLSGPLGGESGSISPQKRKSDDDEDPNIHFFSIADTDSENYKGCDAPPSTALPAPVSPSMRPPQTISASATWGGGLLSIVSCDNRLQSGGNVADEANTTPAPSNLGARLGVPGLASEDFAASTMSAGKANFSVSYLETPQQLVSASSRHPDIHLPAVMRHNSESGPMAPRATDLIGISSAGGLTSDVTTVAQSRTLHAPPTELSSLANTALPQNSSADLRTSGQFFKDMQPPNRPPLVGPRPPPDDAPSPSEHLLKEDIPSCDTIDFPSPPGPASDEL